MAVQNSTTRPKRKCAAVSEVVRIHELAFAASKPNKKNLQMVNLKKIWVPGNVIMQEARKFSLINSALFCSTPGRKTSNEASASMLECNPYCNEIIDAYSGVLEINIAKNNIGPDEHCIFFPIEFSEDILTGDLQGRARSYLDSHMSSKQGTMQIFSPISIAATPEKQQHFGLVCIDLLDFVVYIFDASYKTPDKYVHISSAYIKFANAEFVDNNPNPLKWKSKFFNYLNDGVPEIDAFHTGPLVCVLMDIFSASCEYRNIKDYISSNNMMSVRALLYQYMEGFHYNAAADR